MREKPKPYHHGDLRNALIQAGLELLAESGTAALDLRQVARKVGVSSAAPYRHFADRQALIAAIVEEGYYRLAQQIQSTLRHVSDEARDQLYAVARAYVHFAQENPWLVREMFSGLTINHETYPDLHQATKMVYHLYVAVIQQGQEQGRVIAGDPRALASVLWSMLHGIAMLTIEQQMRPYTDGPEGIDRIARLSMQVLYEGLGHPGSDS